MEGLYRYVSGCMTAAAAVFAPLPPLAWCVAAFIGADFATGVAASRTEARRAGRRWRFESREAWRTAEKLGFSIMAIAMACVMDALTRGIFAVELARMFAGFVCGVEMWSFLENACRISDAPLLRWLRRYVGRKMRREAGDE